MLASFLWSSYTANASAGQENEQLQVVIVSNLTGEKATLSKNQIRDIFLGRGDSKYVPVVPVPGTKSRIVFNTQIIGLKESRIQSFYAQMRFSGRANPPTQLGSAEELIAFVVSKPNGITYLPKNTPIPDELTIIYEVD